MVWQRCTELSKLSFLARFDASLVAMITKVMATVLTSCIDGIPSVHYSLLLEQYFNRDGEKHVFEFCCYYLLIPRELSTCSVSKINHLIFLKRISQKTKSFFLIYELKQ